MRTVRQHGFTYIGVLIAIAIMGVGLLLVSQVWSATSQRQRVEQLKWVGGQYKRALASYYYAGPAGAWVLPTHLEELVEDRRFTPPKHHLRRLYLNPLTGKMDWNLIQVAGHISGVLTPVNNANYVFNFTPPQ